MSTAIHKNVKATWYGVVLAQTMQNQSLSMDLRGLVALVSTFPRENWTWHGEHLRKLTGWTRPRWQKIIREAKAAGFVTIMKLSRGNKGIRTEYHWNIDKAPKIQRSSHRVGNMSDEKHTGHKPGLLNNCVQDNDSIETNERKSRTLSATQKPTKKQAVQKNCTLPEDFMPSPENTDRKSVV